MGVYPAKLKYAKIITVHKTGVISIPNNYRPISLNPSMILSKKFKVTDKKLYSCGVFINLKKAFDSVDYSILLSKLDDNGIRGTINCWFSSYLTNRYQATQVGCYRVEFDLLSVVGCHISKSSVAVVYLKDLSLDPFSSLSILMTYVIVYMQIVIEKFWRKSLMLSFLKLANKLTLNIQKYSFVVFHPRQIDI